MIGEHAQPNGHEVDRARAWLVAARDPAIADAMQTLFAQVADETARLRPRCDASGRCCNFEAYGHRLYLTGLEVAYTVTLHRDSLLLGTPPLRGGLGSGGTGVPPVRSSVAPVSRPVATSPTDSLPSSSPLLAPIPASSSALSLPLCPPVPPSLRPLSSPSLADAIARGGCPFQSGTRCGIHAIRPLPCRVYFCDPAAQDWQHDLTERLLRRLRTLHDDHAIPYLYAEWRQLLGMVIEAESE
ncbi:MAG: hypothetical protein ACKVW3_01620 [Phycisphaerales bacterium]